MILELELAVIDLDTKNPRIPASSSQVEALGWLIRVGQDNLVRLALDIAERKSLNHLARLAVVKSVTDGGRYSVLDGNRRVAALRLLSSPGLIELADLEVSSSNRTRLKRAAEKFELTSIGLLDCYLFTSREEAFKTINLMHTGSNEGRGQDAWNAVQVARHANTGIWQSLDTARQDGHLNAACKAEIDTTTFGITSYARVVQTAAFGAEFGCTVGERTFVVGSQPERALKALGHVANEVQAGLVSSRKSNGYDFSTAETMKPYVDALAAIYPRAKRVDGGDGGGTNGGHDGRSGGGSGGGGGARPDDPGSKGGAADSPGDDGKDGKDGKGDAPSKPVPRGRKRNFVVRAGEMQFARSNPKAYQLVTELSRVNVDKAPLGVSFLIRSLLEVTCVTYCETFGEKAPNVTQAIDKAVGHMHANKYADDPANRTDLIKVIATRWKNEYDQLSDWSHSTISYTSGDAPRASFEALSGGLEMMWQHIYKQLAASPKSKFTK